jgi:DNA-binding CsgD family transcriptional regulator
MEFSTFKRIFDVNILFEAIRKYWLDFHKSDIEPSITPFEIDTTLLESLASERHTLYAVFDHINFKILFVGKNAIDFCGYEAAEILEYDMRIIFKMLRLPHLYFFVNILKWYKSALAKFPAIYHEPKLVSYTCGIDFTHKNGQKIKLLVRNLPIQHDEKGNMIKSITEFVDVTSLIKSDEYWTLFSTGKENYCNLAFFSDTPDGKGTKLVTPRELEILHLIAQNFTTREIADQLFISIPTVEKHRKNMIARVGARDTVALVEICKKCGVV